MSVGPTMICSGDMHSVIIEEIELQMNCSHLADRNFISHLLVGSNFVFLGGFQEMNCFLLTKLFLY